MTLGIVTQFVGNAGKEDPKMLHEGIHVAGTELAHLFHIQACFLKDNTQIYVFFFRMVAVLRQNKRGRCPKKGSKSGKALHGSSSSIMERYARRRVILLFF